MDYHDYIEVLEALDFDLVHGGRDWVGDYHREDVIALGQALYHAQIGPVTWKSKVNGDPFARDFESRLAELMITPEQRGAVCVVTPSYYTYRPSIIYLLDAVTFFYTDYLPEHLRIERVRYTRYEHQVVIEVLDDHDKPRSMTALHSYHEYENGARLRAALMHTLCLCNEAVITQALGCHANRRDYMWYAVHYLDELWGMHIAS